uniref:Glycolipid transfer protein domain-containing protein n=2 Tax=Prymnesium polylepis TaxID=72548 RepID=A0A7S4K9L3_9EUKA
MAQRAGAKHGRVTLLTVLAATAALTAQRHISHSSRVAANFTRVDMALAGSAASTSVGHVTNTWEKLLKQQAHRANGDFPVEAFLHAVEVQSKASQALGRFMLLICRCDDTNVKKIREGWERHSRPRSLRALAEAEKRSGVQDGPGRLVDSATLSLLWATRMQAFWLGILEELADITSHVHMPEHATAVVYKTTVEPYHGRIMRGLFKTALRALPSKSEMLHRLAPDGAAVGTPPPEHLVADLKRCVQVTSRVIAVLRAMLKELGLSDSRQI